MDPRPEIVERREDVGMWVAVPVVESDPDQGDLRADRRQEGGVRGRRPVVGDGQHLGTQAVAPLGQQVGLSLPLDVPGEQHAGPATGDAHDGGGLVQLAAGRTEGPPRRGVEDLKVEVAHDRDLATRRRPDRDALGRGHRVDLGSGRQVRRQR